MNKFFLKLICILILSSGLHFNKGFSQVTSQEIDVIVQNALDNFTIAGVAVAIVKDGKIIHQKGYGLKSIDSKDKVNEHTNFGIASNSKAFTTAALAMLVEERKLSWKD